MLVRRVVAVVVLIALVAAAVAVGWPGGVLDAAFLGIVAALLWLVGVVIARSMSQARVARRSAQTSLELDDDEIIARAVAEERTRLSSDIDRQLRVSLAQIENLAAGSENDPHADLGAAARAVHRASREATAELRRQLGLLRDVVHPADTADASRARRGGLAGSDLLIAAATIALAVGEGLAYIGHLEPYAGWASALTTALAASTVVWWRLAPVAGALTAGAVWLASAFVGLPVFGGVWVFAGFGLLAYGAATRARAVTAIVTLAAFCALVGVATTIVEPLNVWANLLTISLAALTGLVVRLGRAGMASARRAEAERIEAVRPAIDAALAAERGDFARELHDTVSHAVGVIAVQAAAAEVSWPAHPERARSALAIAHHTAVEALDELGRTEAATQVGMGSDAAAGLSPEPSATALIERFRLAGLDVSFDADEVPTPLQPLVVRVVQEGLTNVLRHSEASSASVEIIRAGEALRVIITDSGRPLDAAHVPGYGLVGLRERVELAGGSFSAQPGVTGGFRVEAALPLERMLA
ncbi:histidine kinase [Cryobacterium sp. BB736]|uniref:sensor histidine kinase n=1 Tax=Cryobacterium sp. BB736 TaxID=2746963 RepID=UPI001874A909|nr:histidine kinase [Cryobacterium sp. BB736]